MVIKFPENHRMTTGLLVAGITALTGVSRQKQSAFCTYEWSIDNGVKANSGWVVYTIFLNVDTITGERVIVVSADLDNTYGAVIKSWEAETAMLSAYHKAMENTLG